MQLAANIDLLFAGRSDALALQLAGSEALGTDMIRNSRPSSSSSNAYSGGWTGLVDDAVMRLSRWWGNCFTEATRQDAQQVLHGHHSGVNTSSSSLIASGKPKAK
eukprot:gene9559-9722_t